VDTHQAPARTEELVAHTLIYEAIILGDRVLPTDLAGSAVPG
jgi:hypothetical protein